MQLHQINDLKKIFILSFLITSVIFGSFWLSLFLAFPGEPISISVIFRGNDLQYFPFVESLSRFELSPTYSKSVTSEYVSAYSMSSFVLHSILFSMTGPFGFVISDWVFIFASVLCCFLLLRDFKIKFPIIIFIICLFWLISNLPTLSYLMAFIVGDRFPRPLVSGPILLSALIFLFRAFRNLEFNLSTKLHFFKSAILNGSLASILLQAIFYPFLAYGATCFLLIIVVLYQRRIQNYLLFLGWIGTAIMVFLLVSTPFIFQQLMGLDDQVTRFGVYDLNSLNRFAHLEQLMPSKTEYVLFFLLGIMLFFKRSFGGPELKNTDLQILFCFSVASFFSPFIFTLISSKMVVFPHLTILKKLGLTISLVVLAPSCVKDILHFKKFPKIHNLLYTVTPLGLSVIFLTFVVMENLEKAQRQTMRPDHFYVSQPETFRKKELPKLFDEIQKKYNSESKPTLLTNDIHTMTYWLLNQKGFLHMPDVFSTVLSNEEIETKLIMMARTLGWSGQEFLDWLIIPPEESNISPRGRIIWFLSHFHYLAHEGFTRHPIFDYERLPEAPLTWAGAIQLPETVKKRLKKSIEQRVTASGDEIDLIIWLKGGVEPKVDRMRNYFCNPNYSKNFTVCHLRSQTPENHE